MRKAKAKKLMRRKARNTDKFYAVFRRIPGIDKTNQHTREEAEERARKCAEREPEHEFYIMTSVTKFAAVKPEIVRTEVEP